MNTHEIGTLAVVLLMVWLLFCAVVSWFLEAEVEPAGKPLQPEEIERISKGWVEKFTKQKDAA